MKTVNVHEAKTNFSRLLARVENGSEAIVICRNGEPISIRYDPTEPLSPDEWPETDR